MASLVVTPYPIADLRSVEDVRLVLDVTLALRIADQARFDIQFSQPAGRFPGHGPHLPLMPFLQ